MLRRDRRYRPNRYFADTIQWLLPKHRDLPPEFETEDTCVRGWLAIGRPVYDALRGPQLGLLSLTNSIPPIRQRRSSRAT